MSLPGWDSLESVGRWVTVYEIAMIVCLAALVGAEVLHFKYSHRKDILIEVRDRDHEEQRKSDAAAAEARRKAEVEGLEGRLAEADEKLAAVQHQQTPRRLTADQKQTLTAAIASHRGQKIKIMTILGDAEAKRFMEDFVEAFDSAGWDYGGVGGLEYGHYGGATDPIGVIVAWKAELFYEKKGPAALSPFVTALSGILPNTTLAPTNEVDATTIVVVIGKKPGS